MDFGSLYNLTPTELNGGLIIFNLLLAFVIQLAIIYLYKKTRHGLSYSRSFTFTLVIIGVLGAAIMMAVQNNIVGAFAIFGAFTIIRFRSILKETSDLAYVFFSLVTGITIGMSHYALALITTAVLAVIIYLLHKFAFGTVSDNFDYLLILVADDTFHIDTVAATFDEKILQRELLHAKYYNKENNEFSLSLRMKEGHRVTDIAEELKKMPNVRKVELLSGKHTSEY